MKIKLLLLQILLVISMSCAAATGIEWHGYTNDISQVAKQSSMPVMLFVMSDTCHWCQKMSSSTLNDPRIIKLINEHFYPMILHANKDQAAFMQLGLQGVPVILIYNNSGKVVKMIPGYNSPDQLMSQLTEFTGAQ